MLEQRLNSYAYTLLEVMVAMVIMGISITAVAGALSGAKGLSGRTEEKVDALRVLKNVLNNPGLMMEIGENERYEKRLDESDEWYCTAESRQLVIDRNQLQLFDPADGDSTASKKDDGEEIDVQGMLWVKICVSHGQYGDGKSLCVERWIPEP